MAKEIERKFLLKETPGFLTTPQHGGTLLEIKTIYQVYICGGKRFGVRLVNDYYENGKDIKKFTIKLGKGLVRREYEWIIPTWLFTFLFYFSTSQIILKQRYSFPYQWHYKNEHGVFESEVSKIEIDEFHYPEHVGNLVLAEIEFPTEELAKQIILPAWFDESEEVTNNPNYINMNIAYNKINKKWKRQQ